MPPFYRYTKQNTHLTPHPLRSQPPHHDHSCISSGSLLELAFFHGIALDADTSGKDELHDVIIHHLISGECQNANTALCASVCSVLLPSTGPSMSIDLTPLLLDAVINLGTKTTFQHMLRCAGISHTSTDSIGVLQSLLSWHCHAFSVRQLNVRRDR